MARNVRLKVGNIGRDALILRTYEPDVSNTGLLAGNDANGIAGLTTLAGDQVITTPGTLIENRLITGNVDVQASDVTIRNCMIVGTAAGPPTGAGNGRSLVHVTSGVRLVVEDCWLRPQMPSYNWNGVHPNNYTMRRCLMERTVDLGRVYAAAGVNTNASFEGCLLRRMSFFSPDPNQADDRTHNDGVQIEGGIGTRIIGCSIEGFMENWPVSENFVAATSDVTTNPPNIWAPPHAYSASGRCTSTSCIQVTPNVSTVSDLVIEDNYFYGGAVAINFADTHAAAGSSGLCGSILRNKFDHWQGIGGGATSTTGRTIAIGQNWLPATLPSAAIADNVYRDTGDPVTVRVAQVNN